MEMVVVMIVAALGGIVAFLNLRGRQHRRLARRDTSGGDVSAGYSGTSSGKSRQDRDTDNDSSDSGDSGRGDGGGGGGD